MLDEMNCSHSGDSTGTQTTSASLSMDEWDNATQFFGQTKYDEADEIIVQYNPHQIFEIQRQLQMDQMLEQISDLQRELEKTQRTLQVVQNNYSDLDKLYKSQLEQLKESHAHQLLLEKELVSRSGAVCSMCTPLLAVEQRSAQFDEIRSSARSRKRKLFPDFLQPGTPPL